MNTTQIVVTFLNDVQGALCHLRHSFFYCDLQFPSPKLSLAVSVGNHIPRKLLICYFCLLRGTHSYPKSVLELGPFLEFEAITVTPGLWFFFIWCFRSERLGKGGVSLLVLLTLLNVNVWGGSILASSISSYPVRKRYILTPWIFLATRVSLYMYDLNANDAWRFC